MLPLLTQYLRMQPRMWEEVRRRRLSLCLDYEGAGGSVRADAGLRSETDAWMNVVRRYSHCHAWIETDGDDGIRAALRSKECHANMQAVHCGGV